MTKAADTIKVFVAEDSGAVRARLLEMLDDVNGAAVVGQTASLPGAIEGIRRTEPDTVVLDIQLADGSGIDVLRKVHGVAPQILFIVLTNHPDKGYREVCMKEGASYFLDKSSEFGKVKEIIGALRLKPIGNKDEDR